MWFFKRKSNDGGFPEEIKPDLRRHIFDLHDSRLIDEKLEEDYKRLINRIRKVGDLQSFFIALNRLHGHILKNSNHLSITHFKDLLSILKNKLKHKFAKPGMSNNMEAVIATETFLRGLGNFMNSKEFQAANILARMGIPNPHPLLMEYVDDMVTIAQTTAYHKLIINNLNRLCGDISEQVFLYVVAIIKMYRDHSINHRSGKFMFLNFFDILGDDEGSWNNLIMILIGCNKYHDKDWGLTAFGILCELKGGKSDKGKFLEIAEMLRNVKIYQTKETANALSGFLQSYPLGSMDENLFRQLVDIMPRIIRLAQEKLGFFPESLFDKFIQRLYEAGSYARFFELLQGRLGLAKRYFAELGNTAYAKKIVSENFWGLRLDQSTFNRLNFYKTGTPLIPLGGRFRTNYLVRILSQSAYIAWKRAQDAGIPVEEIVRAYSTKDGSVRVYCKYEGESFYNYLKANPKNVRKLTKQKNKIIKELNRLKIVHGHLHDRNFTVKDENGRLTVKAIDFDKSISPKPE